MTVELFSNNAATTLNGAITSGATSITVTSSTGFPAASSGATPPTLFRVIIDTELLTVTNVSGTTWTVTRGAESSAAAAHADGATVTHIVTSGVLDRVAQKLAAQTTQAGTTYTLALTDADRVVDLTNASAVTVTVPPNSSVAFPVGSSVTLRQWGTGQVTLSPGAGVTLRSRDAALKTAGQYSWMTVAKRATDEWAVTGDVTA